MTHTPDRREHFNLYYIFEEDKAAHPPDGEAVERLREKLLKMLAEKNTS